MNILFVTLLDIGSFDEHGIYTDLLRCFIADGHNVYLISPSERRYGMTEPVRMIKDGGGTIVKVRIGNIQKTNVIEKGISTLLIEKWYSDAVDRYLSDVRFDALLYSTPPITFGKVIERIRRRDGAKTYLLLKDIFPQNAVDIGMMRGGGLLHRFFRRKELRLYQISDRIGCMSRANVDYLLRQNPQLDPDRVEVCPNSIEPLDVGLSDAERGAIRDKYAIPRGSRVFVYGGNLGRPQDVPFIIECLKTQLQKKDRYFLIVGSGTDYSRLAAFFDETKPGNMKLLPALPRDEYDSMISACDIGLIFLDHRFTIPNFPSRLLAYMQASLPVLAVTDPNTDIGDVIEGGGFGSRCESGDADKFARAADEMCRADLTAMGSAARRYLEDHYTARHVCDIITRFIV